MAGATVEVGRHPLAGVPIDTGYEAYDSPLGVRVLRVHYSADDEKRSAEWVENAKRGMPIKEFLREYEMVDTIYDGEAVFPEFSDSIHLGPDMRFKTESIPLMDGAIYIGGWDCSTSTINLAFTMLQITVNPFQVHCIFEMVSEGGESMETFCPRLRKTLHDRYAGYVAQMVHYGDPMGGARCATGKTAFQIAAEHGFVIRPSTNAWHVRQDAVVWHLLNWIDESTPRFLVSERDCPTVVEGLRGAYQWRTSKQGDQEGAGRVLLEPIKNFYSHVADALQYALVASKRHIGQPPAEVKSRFHAGEEPRMNFIRR